MPAGRLKVQLVNTRGTALGEAVDISLHHLTTGANSLIRRQSAARCFVLTCGLNNDTA